MPAVHLELGKKYATDDAFELPRLIDLVLGAADGDAVDSGTPVAEAGPVRQQLAATYFDTPDLALTAAGLSLRRRTGGEDAGWHLDVPAGKGGRAEVRLPPGRATRTVPDPLQRMVRAHSRGAALRPVAETVTERTVRRLVDATGQVLAEIADDRVIARRLLTGNGNGDGVGAPPSSWREIEVELLDGHEDLLAAVDARLRAEGLREAPAVSKVAQVLDGSTGPRRREKRKLTGKSTAGEVVLAHVREQVEQVRAQDLPVRLDAPDSIHKMRVATRRLRSALTTFKPLFASEVARPLRGELKWLAGELGAARDAEVMRDRVTAAVETDHDESDLAAAAQLAGGELGQAYQGAHDRVLAELDGERYHRLLDSLEELVTSPPFTGRAADRATRVLPKLVARSYSVVRRLVEDSASRPAGAEREELLHDARKAAKAARYAGESVTGVFGRDAIAFAQAMEAVQEALGEHQDSVLTRERLRDLARKTSATQTAFLYGRLHALEEARAEQSQQRFDDAWRAAGRKSLHRWLR